MLVAIRWRVSRAARAECAIISGGFRLVGVVTGSPQ
jgi:hypothetical protein